MQAKPKIAKILVVALIVSLVLGGCGGGTSGKTWFNLPSVKLNLQTDGTASVWGFGLGPVVQPSLVQQLQSANIQKLEIRIGYNGIHAYVNGQDMPYIAWDEGSVTTLQDVLPRLSNIPNGGQIASALPWLRTIGLGVTLNIPVAQGQTALDIPRWTGETSVTAEQPPQTTIGPLTIGSLVFDSKGNAIVEGMPAATLEQALGVKLPSLDPNTLAILSALNAQSVKISTNPNGISLSLNDKPLPGIAYDSQYLDRLVKVAGQFVKDPATLVMLNQVVSILPGAKVDLAVSFTGQPAAQTQLPPISVAIQPNGAVNVLGIPVSAAPIVPTEIISKFQTANVQHLGVSVKSDGLVVTANDQVLPTVTWSDASLTTLSKLVGPLAGLSPELVDQVVGMVRKTGLDIQVAVPLAQGAQAIQIPGQITVTMQAPDIGQMSPPSLRLNATYSQNNLTGIGTLSADDLAKLGVSNLPGLPANVATILDSLGVKKVQVETKPNALVLLLDGAEALTVNYDAKSLLEVLNLAAPFIQGSPLDNPGVSKIVREQIVPLVPSSQVDVTVNLQ